MILHLLGCGLDLAGFLPTVTFNRLQVEAIDFDRIDTQFVFDVDNPNPVGAPVDRFSYALALEDIELISGDDPDGLELVADGTSELALPVTLEFGNIYDTIQATRGLDFVGFGLRGGFGWDTDIGPVDVLYDEDGSFPALRIPKFKLGKLRVTDIGASEVGFGLDVDVGNDHGSTINFSALDFDIEFAGVHVGGGELDQLGEVAGATEETLTIPFYIDYLDAIEAITGGGRLQLGLDATMDVDTPFGIIPLHVDETGDIDVVQ